MNQHFGKYRGKVSNNLDPMLRGRVQVSCPDVLGDVTALWAMPSVPYAGPGVGLLAVPPIGADVWVEFEGGNAALPIWSGCFWGSGQAPGAGPTTKVFKTDGLSLTVDDLPGSGGVTLVVGPPVVSTPLTISLTAAGIELSNGAASVRLTAASVSVNDGALEVI
ncbi:baseplate assembly protein [Streptomyces sp. NRRL WC-3618]|jgi:hypothetical protein|uniref:phage baseplate assembly protein V n=1 Tax=unclassified Streptomyces TaxID=2593676 RepID=UPI0006AF7B6A|nr:phage baseplate assembly protein V [Streptomyces sp. NRRL WC-3618]KOV88197.1 baseplate assembly protein [Streptomyces sp. NRRL WC-3618]